MELDTRQLDLVKGQVREMIADARTIPTAKSAPRWELISIILAQNGMEDAAECARAAACRFGEGIMATEECEATMEKLQ